MAEKNNSNEGRAENAGLSTAQFNELKEQLRQEFLSSNPNAAGTSTSQPQWPAFWQGPMWNMPTGNWTAPPTQNNKPNKKSSGNKESNDNSTDSSGDESLQFTDEGQEVPRKKRKRSLEDNEDEDPLEEVVRHILAKASSQSNIVKLTKEFNDSKELMELQSPWLEAFVKDDQLEFSGITGGIYSSTLDTKIQEANQCGLDALKPLINLIHQCPHQVTSEADLQQALKIAAGLIYKCSHELNKVRLALILKQVFPGLCKRTKVDTLVKRLSKDVEFSGKKQASLTGGWICKENETNEGSRCSN
jgi:hypothetical protein